MTAIDKFVPAARNWLICNVILFNLYSRVPANKTIYYVIIFKQKASNNTQLSKLPPGAAEWNFNIQNNDVWSLGFIVVQRVKLNSLPRDMCRREIKFNDIAWTFYAHTSEWRLSSACVIACF